jgi:hypothetical protein
LNPFDTGGQISADVIDQRRTGRQTAAIGYVAMDETILHSRKHALSV